MPNKLIIFILSLFLITELVYGGEIQAIPENNSDIINIKNSAKHIADQSMTNCLTAICVKGDCQAADNIIAPLLEVDSWLAGIEPLLVRQREFYTNNALTILETARHGQERADQLRRLQLLQDTLQVISKAAAEAASWREFLLGKSDLVNKHSMEVLEKIYGYLDRLDEFVGYFGLGEDKKQEFKAVGILKLVLEINSLSIELRRSLKINGLNQKNKLRLGTIFRKVLSLYVDIDRKQRQLRIEMYEKNMDAEYKVLRNMLDWSHLINERIRIIIQTRGDIQRALLGIRVCKRKICKEPGSLPDFTIAPKKTDMKLLPALRYFNQNIQKAWNKLQDSASKYKIIADHRSSISLKQRKLDAHSLIKGKYNISNRCIPDDAHFLVYRLEKANNRKLVMDLGKKTKAVGNLSFRVLVNLNGSWSGTKGRKYNISIEDQDITLTKISRPLNRIYKGSLKDLPSHPGNYELVLYSEDKNQSYLPTPFTIEDADSEEKTEIELYSKPTGLNDLNPVLSEKIRQQIFIIINEKGLRYKAILEMDQSQIDNPRLKAHFWTYTFKLGKRDGIVIKDSVKEKGPRVERLSPDTME